MKKRIAKKITKSAATRIIGAPTASTIAAASEWAADKKISEHVARIISRLDADSKVTRAQKAQIIWGRKVASDQWEKLANLKVA